LLSVLCSDHAKIELVGVAILGLLLQTLQFGLLLIVVFCAERIVLC
jgi:hypothetical protein